MSKLFVSSRVCWRVLFPQSKDKIKREEEEYRKMLRQIIEVEGRQ